MRATRLVVAVLSLLSLVVPGLSRADEAKRLMVLRGGAPEIDVALRDTIDQVLLESVSVRPSFSSVDVSPVPFEDVELAAGCSSRDADCLQRIAATLDADWLMVRELVRDRDGNLYLTLIAHDGPTARVTRRAVAEVADDPRSAPSRVVPLLVDRLYPTLTPAETAAPEASGALPPALPPLSIDAKERRWSTLNVVGASTVGVGAVALTAGITLWALSQRDARDYQDLEIRSPGDVDRAVDLHHRADLRASVGRGLVISGTLAAVAGAVTLLWTPLRKGREPRAPGLQLQTARAGLGLGLCGGWRGGL